MNESSARVLVADDDATMRLLLQTALESKGFSVSLAEDGTEALSAFRDGNFDVVLLDVEMPGLSGFEVCESIRHGWGRHIPVVLITGNDDVVSIERAFACGATDFISKPINWSLIGHRLRYVLNSAAMFQSLNAAQAQNRAILRALPDLLLKVDDQGRVREQHGEPGLQRAFLGEETVRQLPQHVMNDYLLGLERARKAGNVQNGEWIVTDEQGRKRYFDVRIAAMGQDEALCLLHDATERREAEQRIRYLAYFDPLTGLHNRQFFQEQLRRELVQAERQGERLAVLFMDLDGFKRINDSLGHHVGDLILQGVAARLSSVLRSSDLVGRAIEDFPQDAVDVMDIARLGGDEFTALLPRIQYPEDTLAVAQRIRRLICLPFLIEGRELVVTTSIGIATYPDDAGDATTLLKYADSAMYAAKAGGRDICEYYSSALTDRAMQRMSLESGLRLALERDEFRLTYQPQVDSRSRAICAVEALIRWQHPEKGLVPPMDFIPLAEEIGVILPIGAWVLRTACRDAMRWQALGLGPIQMAVNLSPVQFRNPDLKADILESLRQSGLPAAQLELEITESTLMEDTGLALSILRDLRDMGIHIALDDFGTGYSSLAYLKQLPLSRLKVDRSFVCDMPDSKQDEAILRAVIALAHNLDMHVIAEGVETHAQYTALAALGCDSMQGYLFSKPVPFDSIVTLLAQRPVELAKET